MNTGNWILAPARNRQRLKNLSVGLFLFDDSVLCVKTEYGNNEGRIDAYIVESGEFFWGAPPQSIASQREQLVRRVNIVKAPPISPDEHVAPSMKVRAMKAALQPEGEGR